MNITLRYIVSISLLVSLIAPNKLDAQCSDLNKSLWENTWESCELAQSPNAQRGEGHWIMYDLGSPYTISTSRIWNSNLEIEKGVKSLIVDYSLDGSTWTPLDTLEIAKAKGSDEYAGVIGPDFNNNEVRYILFHIESTWGHQECAGFSEISININDQFTGSTDENDDADDSENGDDETNDGDDETDDEHDEEECEYESEMEECTVPTNVTALVLNSNEVWILWEDESVGSYLVSYRTDGSDWIEIETEGPEVFIEELEPGEAYEFFVQTLCDEDESLSSEIEGFYMPEESDGCRMPTYSNVFESQDGYVIVVWQESEDAEGYKFRYRSKGSDEEWLLIRTEENVVEFEDVDIEVEYEYQVRVNCDGEWSKWSVIFDNSIENEEDLTTGIDDLSRERAVVKKMKINVYPNPTSDIIQFSIVTDAKTTLHIQLFDIVGKPYQLIKRNAQKGVNTYDLEIQNLSSGTYFLSVKDMVSQLEGTSRLMVMNE